jgi:hypothetical protein
MADEKKKKDPNDVSGMTAEERYRHVQDSHKLRQLTVTPHDLRVAERKKANA